MLNHVTNRDMKDLLSKKKLTPELLMEIKTSFFIHPSRPTDDNMFQFTYSDTPEGKVFYLFTSLDEYNKCFKDNDELQPEPWFFNSFEDALYLRMWGIIINPGSDNVLIPVWPAFHIIEDINSNNKVYERNFPFHAQKLKTF